MDNLNAQATSTCSGTAARCALTLRACVHFAQAAACEPHRGRHRLRQLPVGRQLPVRLADRAPEVRAAVGRVAHALGLVRQARRDLGRQRRQACQGFRDFTSRLIKKPAGLRKSVLCITGWRNTLTTVQGMPAVPVPLQNV